MLRSTSVRYSHPLIASRRLHPTFINMKLNVSFVTLAVAAFAAASPAHKPEVEVSCAFNFSSLLVILFIALVLYRTSLLESPTGTAAMMATADIEDTVDTAATATTTTVATTTAALLLLPPLLRPSPTLYVATTRDHYISHIRLAGGP